MPVGGGITTATISACPDRGGSPKPDRRPEQRFGARMPAVIRARDAPPAFAGVDWLAMSLKRPQPDPSVYLVICTPAIGAADHKDIGARAKQQLALRRG